MSPTGRPLRALLVEDVELDAQLLVRELKRGGFEVSFERVDTSEAMSAALARQTWDVVISDFSMPSFSGLAALALVKERKLDLPFIIVSGEVGEETAVEAILAGAHDFVAKGKFLRLIPAVERELRNAALRVERSKMQEQLLISERMASVGVLAAGVAHEINNPLAALMANLEMVAEDVAKLTRDTGAPGPAPSDDPTLAAISLRLGELVEPLRDACESAERVRLIVRDLKVFSRSDEEKIGAVDIHRVLETSLRLGGNEVRHRARVVKDFGDVPEVEGNEARLGQVFVNLIVNAAQAMPAGRADGNEIRILTRRDDQGRVVVEVRDTGSGIPAAVLPRVFDPFFTTKPIGIGTGLGLAICHRIITALGGQIEIESQEGVGTVFRILLAVASRVAPAEVAPAPTHPAAAPGRRGRVLVVDDEPKLGAAVRRMLATDHDVLAVTRARDALERISGDERYDVILCDLMMPDMTGMDLHAELSTRAPEQAQRMVFMTGGAFTTQARAFLKQVENPRLEKPIDADQLRALVRQLAQ